ncbi:MAG: hypothetical protein WBL85_11295 [Sedimentisphaerales bacterium]
MTDNQQQGSGIPPANELPAQASSITPETLKSAMKAFKKRLKLTALDDDSNLGRGPFSSGAKGVYAIQPPNQFPREVWEELCRLGKLRNSGHGMYELPKEEK